MVKQSLVFAPSAVLVRKPRYFSGSYQAIEKDELRIIGEKALTWVRRYIREVRPTRPKESTEGRVFVGMRCGKPLSNRALTELLAYRLKRAEVSRIAPHRLRASAASHMVNAGMNIGFVQQILGHNSLDTTRVYVQIHSNELKKIIEVSHPRKHLEKRRVNT